MFTTYQITDDGEAVALFTGSEAECELRLIEAHRAGVWAIVRPTADENPLAGTIAASLRPE